MTTLLIHFSNETKTLHHYRYFLEMSFQLYVIKQHFYFFLSLNPDIL